MIDGPYDVTVSVSGKPCEVTICRKTKSVWVAVGSHNGRHYEIKGSSRAVVQRDWVKAAPNTTTGPSEMVWFNSRDYAQQRVPERLQVAVARCLGNGKPKQYLKKSLCTKDMRTANVRAKPVQAGFDRLLREAALLAAPVITPPLRSLSAAEIARMPEALFGKPLADDEAFRFGGKTT
jgi:hypothetical protein